VNGSNSLQPGTEQPKASFRKTMVDMIRHVFLHNAPLKIIAIVISVLLWAGLVSQDESITRDKTFQNVNVSVIGQETMRNNGFVVVSDLEQLLDEVSITAAVPQKQYDNAESSAYNLRLDLSRINGTGEQEIKLLATNSSTFGRVVSISPSSVMVSVEDYIIRQRIPISAAVNGEVPSGWHMSSLSVDPSLIAVSGPRSLVETISWARAYVNTSDIEWAEGTPVFSSEIRLYNRSGEEVSSPLLRTTTGSLTIDSVLIETTLLPTLTFDVADLVNVIGEPLRGYHVADVRISPENVTVAAKGDVLAQMTELPMERNVNIRDLSETTVFQLKVQKPSEDAVLTNDTVTVTVIIEADEP